MVGYVGNLDEQTSQNEYFRQVLFTASKSQLVLMALQPGEDIGLETHPEHDQFIRIESGSGQAVLNGQQHDIAPGFAVVIPAGTEHNISNTSAVVMKLYTIYTPPEHQDGTIHKTKAEAQLT